MTARKMPPCWEPVSAMLGEIRDDVRGMHESVRRIEQTLYVGNGHKPVLSRLEALEVIAESSKPVSKAERWGGIGTALGAAVIAILGYFGVRPTGP